MLVSFIRGPAAAAAAAAADEVIPPIRGAADEEAGEAAHASVGFEDELTAAAAGVGAGGDEAAQR